MVELIYNFDIEPYLNQLSEKKIHIQKLADIEKIYTSKEYSHFITDLYVFFFNNTHELCPTNSDNNKCQAIRSIINHFWMSFLGADLIDKYILRLRKLKI